MEKYLKARLLHTAALLMFTLPASAAGAAPAGESAELYTRLERYHVRYSLNDDYTSSETHDWAMKVLKEKALSSAKETSISYSTSIEKAEVLSAYTIKADGRRIDAPKSNFQVETNTGNAKDAPVYSDRTTLTVVFPEVAVGDTVGFSYKLTQTEPMFPKQYSIVQYFNRGTAYDDAKITLDYPAALAAQLDVRELTPDSSTEKNGRKELSWTFSNKVPLKDKRNDYSVFDVDTLPGLAFSTFKSYADIAQAYGARATPKAAVTEEVQALADQIAKDQKTPRDTARTLYDWVSTNITYAGNCIGTGAVVPHDISFILKNKMGDCKDHATLLQALLAARKIDSTQALINAGSGYRLAKVPVVSRVNHVINYLPAFDLFVDSTSDSTPFGMLPYSSQDKPALMVDGFKEGLKTPAAPAGSNVQTMKTRIRINDDGSVSGNVDVALKGQYALGLREGLRNASKENMDDMVKNVLKGMGYTGTGKFEGDDPAALTNTLNYKASFEFKNFTQFPGAGAFVIHPVFVSSAPVARFTAVGADDEATPTEFACSNGASLEEYVFTFPKKMKVLAVPDNMTFKSANISYKASYRLKGNQLTVTREVDDHTRGNVCAAAIAEEYKAFSKKVLPNLKAQVVYK
ncbi:Transglutaminase-like enzymes, putative cysteine proteases [Janthinobacterium sp. CG23_2]|nr:Transglutaminase-like enzymes, putative cysteine proteases [Janthinobacterium sp. CG23_2]CUU32380.1 Transglutaminase-like enzymes, putative cysteine proteases [Janthinobacterium sp. CG23_2]